MSKLHTLRQGGFLFLTLDDAPTRNALSPEMVDALRTAFAAAAADGGVRAVVLRGANGTFCAGGSMGDFNKSQQTAAAAGAPDPIALNNRRFGEFMTALQGFPKVLVVVVDGAAMGGGLGLASVADILLVHKDAKFALSETTLGLVPAQIAPFVVAKIGQAQTRRLALSGERIDGIEAARIGLANIVCNDAIGLEAALVAILRGIGSCAPGANAATKSLIAQCAALPLAQVLDNASALFARQMRGEGTEGVAAFRDKRDAAWVERIERLPEP